VAELARLAGMGAELSALVKKDGRLRAVQQHEREEIESELLKRTEHL